MCQLWCSCLDIGQISLNFVHKWLVWGKTWSIVRQNWWLVETQFSVPLRVSSLDQLSLLEAFPLTLHCSQRFRVVLFCFSEVRKGELSLKAHGFWARNKTHLLFLIFLQVQNPWHPPVRIIRFPGHLRFQSYWCNSVVCQLPL